MKWVPDWILKLIGKEVGSKLNLQEASQMDGTKPWWQSKTIWSGIAAAWIGIYNAVGGVKGLPPIPDWVFAILGGIGIYTRVQATDKIG